MFKDNFLFRNEIVSSRVLPAQQGLCVENLCKKILPYELICCNLHKNKRSHDTTTKHSFEGNVYNAFNIEHMLAFHKYFLLIII